MLNIRSDARNVKPIPYHIAIRRQTSETFFHCLCTDIPMDILLASIYVVGFLSGDGNILVVADIRERTQGPQGDRAFFADWGNGKGKVLGWRFLLSRLPSASARPHLDVAKERRRQRFGPGQVPITISRGFRRRGLDATLDRTANVIPRTSQVVRCNLSASNRIERVRMRERGGRGRWLDGSLKVKRGMAIRRGCANSFPRVCDRSSLDLISRRVALTYDCPSAQAATNGTKCDGFISSVRKERFYWSIQKFI